MSTYGYLAHHGVKGQKWGIRRYQNADGSLTAEGMARYGINSKDPNRNGNLKTRTKALKKAANHAYQTYRYNDYEGNKPEYELIDDALKKVYGEDAYKKYRNQKKKRAAAIGSLVTAGLIGGGALLYIKTKGKGPSMSSIKKTIDKSIEDLDDIEPKNERAEKPDSSQNNEDDWFSVKDVLDTKKVVDDILGDSGKVDSIDSEIIDDLDDSTKDWLLDLLKGGS